MDFGEALNAMKQGNTVSRTGWNNSEIKVGVQFPNSDSKITKPFIYMEKKQDKFPLDLSCESIFAVDWEIVY